MFRLIATTLFAVLAAGQDPQQPVIRSGVELVLVDVQVTGRDGQPFPGLTPQQFEVTIDGRTRPVVTLDYVRYPNRADAPAAGEGPPAQQMVGAGESMSARLADEGRTLILAIDQASFIVPSEPAAVEVVKRIAAMAHPRDSIGIMTYPVPGISLPPTRDREALLDAAKQIAGQLQLPRGRVVLSLGDAIDWSTDADYRKRIYDRECPASAATASGMMVDVCYREVEMAANEMVGNFQMQAMRSVSGLRSVVDAVQAYPGRKTLVIVSAGFAASDRIGGKPDITFEADMLGQRTAQTNIVLYSLHMDVAFLQAFSSVSAGSQLQTVFRNSQMLAKGLEQFTASGGGSTISVMAGPDAALKRLLGETGAYYLLGVEPLAVHRDGKLHRIQVKVKQRGAEVRARNTVLIPKGPG
jgi:VWFA-related protein